MRRQTIILQRGKIADAEPPAVPRWAELSDDEANEADDALLVLMIHREMDRQAQ